MTGRFKVNSKDVRTYSVGKVVLDTKMDFGLKIRIKMEAYFTTKIAWLVRTKLKTEYDSFLAFSYLDEQLGRDYLEAVIEFNGYAYGEFSCTPEGGNEYFYEITYYKIA